jgi:hypothetical protein
MPPENDKVTRLVDMLVEEVSLVDRAANRRKFLVVKRSEPMPPGAEVTQQSDGTYTAGGTPEPTPKADIALTKDAQGALQGVVESALKMVEDALAMVKKAKVVEEPGEQDATALVELLATVAGGFEDAVTALGGAEVEEASEQPAAAAPAPGAAPATAPAPASAVAPAPPVTMGLGKRLELLAAQRVVRRAEFEKQMGTVVQKLGARMAKERLARFKNALSILSSLLAELDSAQAAADLAAEKARPAPAPPPPVTPDMQAEVAKLTKQVTDLQSELKKQAEEAAAIRAKRDRSNGIPVEKSVNPESERVSWPLDMNRPFRRAELGKDAFFEPEER